MAWTVFACLCLLLGSVAEKLHVISPFDVVIFPHSAAISLSYLSWTTQSLPIEDWYVSFWVQIKAGTPSNAKLLQVTTADRKLFYVTWPTAAVPAFTYDGNIHIVTGTVHPPFRQENKWIHIVFGYSLSRSYGVATLRESFNNQFTVNWIETIGIGSEFALQGPVSEGPFFVRTKQGYYVDVVVGVGEYMNDVEAQEIVGKTFLCSNPAGGSSCRECHISCASCDTDNLCTACRAEGLYAASKVADGAACVCNAGTGAAPATLHFHDQCGLCHESCEVCGNAGDANSCRGCADSHAGLSSHSGIGTCVCKAGFSPKVSPTPWDACVSCVESEVQCMTQEQADFINHVADAYSLPCLIEALDHRICYYNALPACDCTPNPMEQIIGPFTEESTGTARPTTAQCYELLKAQWPFITYWFRTLFPDFRGPADASDSDILAIKSILYLWIQQFGPAEIGGWTNIKSAVNGEAANWANYLAWVDFKPGFSLDAGATVFPFPVHLLSWLQTLCAQGTAVCKELALFNLKSTVCHTSTCPAAVLELCSQVSPTSDCVLSR